MQSKQLILGKVFVQQWSSTVQLWPEVGLKANFKATFMDDDSGVKSEVERFHGLIEAHQSIQATQTLKGVLESGSTLKTVLFELSETGHKVDFVFRTIEKQTTDKNNKKEIEEIRKSLPQLSDKFVMAYAIRSLEQLKTYKHGKQKASKSAKRSGLTPSGPVSFF